MPIVLIKDEDLTYHGKALSVRYEEERLRAIHAMTGTDERQGRLGLHQQRPSPRIQTRH
ncbi:hypothetical protein BGZ63DRAFT_425138 [Mariannaea sp. PMI_226]|nr:hypothetical protein BGZ63DRAFT_425138 [Mariannaea sp. PMI_226]